MEYFQARFLSEPVSALELRGLEGYKPRSTMRLPLLGIFIRTALAGSLLRRGGFSCESGYSIAVSSSPL